MAAKIRALVADDETHIRFFVKNVLESMNMEVVGEATNGEEAVDMFDSEKPHMLLMDINMPVKCGAEALEEIRARHPDALVVILTSAVNRQTVEKFIKLGASGFIRKDTSLADIKKIIKDTWNRYIDQRDKKSGWKI